MMTGEMARKKLSRYLFTLAEGHTLEVRVLPSDLTVQVQQKVDMPSVLRPFLTKEANNGGVHVKNDKYRESFAVEDAPDDLLEQVIDNLDTIEAAIDYELKLFRDEAEGRIAAARKLDEKIIEVMEEKYVPGWTDSEG